MIREFDEEELKHPAPGRDTELTLGAGTLLALGCGLLLLCCVCFGLGYAVGHRGRAASGNAISPPVVQSPPQPGSAAAKPTAKAQTQAPAAVATVARDNSPAASATQAAEVRAGSAVENNAETKTAVQPAVRPALAGQGSAEEPPRPAPALHVQPALAQVQGWMVQIAAVPHAEDAEVLVNALKKRGYAVTVRRDLADTLLHVQTGPFVSRNDANAMRQKLQNDGYNAIVQP
jgi:cell division septation protein DedD